MLDIKWIRNHAEQVQQAADQKGLNVSVAELLVLEEKKRKLLFQTEQLRQARNQQTQQIQQLLSLGQPDLVETAKEEVRRTNYSLSQLEAQFNELSEQVLERALLIPNIMSADTPIGLSDQDNVVLRTIGSPPTFSFAAKSHVELGELHHMIDIPRGVKTSGSRFYYLKNQGALLHRAVQQLALDYLVQKGFSILEVPLMVREGAMESTGFFPTGRDQSYGTSEHWLVGTSEVPLISYHSNEIIDVSTPVLLAAASTCFRSEVGSAGRDVHGLYRVHQFSKVEQVVLCEANLEQSEQILHMLTRNAEDILQLLELPYQVVAVCSGDLSQKNYKQYDIETWMPSRHAYGETHSSSNVLDFQSRRSNIRYRNAHGELQYCYTLNNTAVASPRILIPLLENHQQEDGSIYIPIALRPYMSGMEYLKP